MGKNIGTLGARREPLDLEFTYFGETVRVHPRASDAVEVEFLEAGRDIDVDALPDAAAIEAMDEQQQAEMVRKWSRAQRAGYLALMDALRQLVHPDDFDRYWKLGWANGQQLADRMADVRFITAKVVEETTDFPTPPPSASPPGAANIPAKSAAASSAAGSDTDQALVLLRGRPDLQEFVVLQEETEQKRLALAITGPKGGQTAAQKLMARRS